MWSSDDLVPHFRGADAVVLLAWIIQPSRDLNKQWMVNVEGSTRVARAAKEAGVPSLLYASSVGAYSPGPKDRRVDESWPTGGVPTSYYGRHKAEVERRLDRFEREAPDVRVVRMRPGLVFKKEAAEGIRRLFAGPFFPSALADPALINVIPDIENLRSQVVHSYDVGEAFRLSIVNEDRPRRVQPRHGAGTRCRGDRTDTERASRARLLAVRPRRRGALVEAQAAARAARMARPLAAGPDHGHDEGQN